ncbi:MAG: FesM [Anaerolineae bacterium]|nr:FesM [Anaerolineae bacterium]
MSRAEPIYRPPLDALRLPLIGHLLRARRGRLLFQIPLLLVSALLIYDGFTGEQIASRNLATVSAWVHYRGFVILALLLAGNLFCMSCPFALPRTLAKRLASRGRRFPRVLRNKWLAIGGLFLIFWLYEVTDMWASPLLTAWIIIAYFVASFALELLFNESPFCKYICPLGAFNFAYSTLSPLQISVRDLKTCQTCVGKECINGSYSAQPVILVDQIGDKPPIKHDSRGVLGCGTLLYAPQIKSNMDCTLCLDCARACPHDNVILGLRSPLRELSALHSLPKRWDVNFLLVALAFMGIVNAFGMVPPVYALLREMALALGTDAEWLLLLIIFLIGSIVLPALLSIGAAWLANALTGVPKRPRALRDTFAAFAPAFVPIGAGIWAAHYGFHFIVGALVIVPVFHNFLLDHGVTIFGTEVNWKLGALLDAEQFAVVQVVLLIGGYLLSLILARRIAVREFGAARAQLAFLPYALLFLALLLASFFIFSQPMEMRGTTELDNLFH